MGLFDLFRRAASQVRPSPAPPPRPVDPYRRFPVGEPARFELDNTYRLRELYAVPSAERDAAWTERFWEAAWTAALMAPESLSFTGPDGFYYLRLDDPGEWTSFPQRSLMHVAESLVGQGFGVAFFSSAGAGVEEAEYVVSMGVLDSILRFDTPAGEPSELEEMRYAPAGGKTRTVLKAGEQVLLGTPSEQYLSKPAARALHHHLTNAWHMTDPRVALIVVPGMHPSRSLVIGRSAAQFAAEGYDQATVDQAVQSLSWYFPPSRALMLMPDDWDAGSMTPLRELF